MIFFKACPRCNGDVDVTFYDEIYCIQCGHRFPVQGARTMRRPSSRTHRLELAGDRFIAQARRGA